MLTKFIKPFGVTVEAAFRRIEAISILLVYFPSPSSRGKTATPEQCEEFQNFKKIPSSLKREMKYNLLTDFSMKGLIHWKTIIQRCPHPNFSPKHRSARLRTRRRGRKLMHRGKSSSAKSQMKLTATLTSIANRRKKICFS